MVYLIKLVAVKFEKIDNWFELFDALKWPKDYLYACRHYTLDNNIILQQRSNLLHPGSLLEQNWLQQLPKQLPTHHQLRFKSVKTFRKKLTGFVDQIANKMRGVSFALGKYGNEFISRLFTVIGYKNSSLKGLDKPKKQPVPIAFNELPHLLDHLCVLWHRGQYLLWWRHKSAISQGSHRRRQKSLLVFRSPKFTLYRGKIGAPFHRRPNLLISLIIEKNALVEITPSEHELVV